jgi:predicted PurR-regulated permease PerM
MATSKRITKTTPVVSKPKKKLTDFGVSGLPINKTQPFYFGFVATLGVLTAIILLRALESVSQIFVLILVSLFLATGLNPAVEALRSRNLSRGSAVAVIFSSVILFVIFFAFVVVPPVVNQGSNLIENAPQLLDDLMKNGTINSLNEQFGLIDKKKSILCPLFAPTSITVASLLPNTSL